jgi:uncharacterized protein YqgC (DUF456 family)
METILLILFSFILMAIGLIGVVLPFLPGVPIAWLGLFIYAWGTGFQKISLTEILVFFALAIVTMLLDFVCAWSSRGNYLVWFFRNYCWPFNWRIFRRVNNKARIQKRF